MKESHGTETVWNIAYPKWNILQFRFQFREDIDCHSQTLLSVHAIVFFSKQEKIHGDIEEHCQLNGNFNRAYHELTVSSVSLSELDTTQQIAIPQQLLEQAGINSNAEVQIACIDGAIIITGDTPLTEDELSEVIGRLRAVNDLTEHFPSELDTEEGGTGYGRF